MISPGIFVTLLTISTGGLMVVAMQNQQQQHQFYQMKDQFSPQVPLHHQVYRNELAQAPRQQLPPTQQQPTSTYNYNHNHNHNHNHKSLAGPGSPHQPLVRSDWSGNLQQQHSNVPLESLSVEQLLKRLQDAQELLPDAANSIHQQAPQMHHQKPPVQQQQQQHPTGFHQMPPNHNRMSTGGDLQQQPATQQQFNMLNKATREQKELKARLIELANKVTNNTPSLPTSTEALLRVDTKTGAITPVEIDPHVAIEQAKLREVLKALSAKRLPVERLGPLLGLGGDSSGHSSVELLHDDAKLEPRMAEEGSHLPSNQFWQQAQHQPHEQSPVRSPEEHQYNYGLVDGGHPMIKQAVIDPNQPVPHFNPQNPRPTVAPNQQIDHQEPIVPPTSPPEENQNFPPHAPNPENKPHSHAHEHLNQVGPSNHVERQIESPMQEPEARDQWLAEETGSLLPDEPAERVRFELDDRIKRISDLLYFRPEFMNLLLRIDDATELSPLESEFKRMVLCNSDEQFCSPSLSGPASAPPSGAELLAPLDQHSLNMAPKEDKIEEAEDLHPKTIVEEPSGHVDYGREYHSRGRAYEPSFAMHPQDRSSNSGHHQTGNGRVEQAHVRHHQKQQPERPRSGSSSREQQDSLRYF